MSVDAVVILGSQSTGLSLAMAAIEAGLSACVIEPDPQARERAEVFARRDRPDLAPQLAFLPEAHPQSFGSAPFVFDARDPEARETPPDPMPDGSIFATPFGTPGPLGAGDPGRAVRFVPFQPMHLRHLTEISGFDQTDPSALQSAEGFARRIGRVPVILPAGAASAGLRLLDRLHAEADALLLEGAVLWELDEAMTEAGFDLGFYEAQDLAGLDVAYARRKALGQPSLIADRAVEEGRIGKKIGWGWYRYPGGGGAVIDPLIEDLVREEAWFADVPQRAITGDEILKRLFAALHQEAVAILSDGGVREAEDLRAILVHGLGYPAARAAVWDPSRDQPVSSA